MVARVSSSITDVTPLTNSASMTSVGVSTDVMLALLVRGVPSVMLLLTRATTLRSPDDLAGNEVVCQVMTLP